MNAPAATEAPVRDQLILLMPEHGRELHLRHGVQTVSRDGAGLALDRDDAPALLRFCVDRRGVWMLVADAQRGVHVNGRKVRRMAMLRVGDAIYVDGVELVLARAGEARQAEAGSFDDIGEAPGDMRVVLRGVGGKHHGRSFTLERPRLVGSAAEADIRIDDAAFAERHAQLSLQGERIALRDLGSSEGSVVNGRPVRDAWLQPGDQLVFDALHRFVVEAPGKLLHPKDALPVVELMAEPQAPAARRSWRRWPWLLLAAVLIGLALAALLLFGNVR
jgi:hypothetical protein